MKFFRNMLIVLTYFLGYSALRKNGMKLMGQTFEVSIWMHPLFPMAAGILLGVILCFLMKKFNSADFVFSPKNGIIFLALFCFQLLIFFNTLPLSVCFLFQDMEIIRFAISVLCGIFAMKTFANFKVTVS